MVNDDDEPFIERDLILSENELLFALSAQTPPNVRFVVVDISMMSISLVMGYGGEYGQVIISVSNADLTRFTISSIT
ncbi:MAG TPA: hypothetical protein PLZ51_03115, partial [Aggregatilineales bacterium]|nr:hypothetical protein [Aggregatilineales bacterium]